MVDIWIFAQQRDDEIEAATYGLVSEAKRLITELGEAGLVTAVALGPASPSLLETLGAYGVHRVLHATNDQMKRYQGEIFGRVLFDLVRRENPACLLMAQTSETQDLAQRVAAMMKTALVTRTMDFSISADGSARAIRPVANGYLFEDVTLDTRPSPIVLFLPSVLFDTEPDREAVAKVIEVDPKQVDDLKTRTVQVIEAAPEELDLTEADIIVAGGRGVGKERRSISSMHWPGPSADRWAAPGPSSTGATCLTNARSARPASTSPLD
jgi:electron transfer flavoprotein alpha subunit